MSFLQKSKVWREKLGAMLFNDMPLIVFVVLVQVLIVAINPGENGGFHFAKVLFFTAMLKAFWLGIATSILSFNKRWLKWMFCLLNVLLFDVYLYLIIQFNVRFNPFVLSLILQTTPQETGEFFMSFFPLKTILALLFSALALFLLYYTFNRFWKKKAKTKQTPRHAFAGIMFLFILSLLANAIYNDPLVTNIPKASTSEISDNNSFPLFQIIGDTHLAFIEINTAFRTTTQKGSNESVRKICQANEEVKIDSCSFISPHIVFIIGESFIKGHSSLYGYQHETNPCLEAERKNGNLFVFSDVIGHSGGTASSMQFFYSTKSVDDDKVWEEQPLFPAIFKKAGYHVYLFDNQSTRTSGSAMFDYSTSFFINPTITHNQCFDYRNERVFPYDLELIENERKRIEKNRGERTLAIFHLYGQHVRAAQRYPNTKEYTYFTSDSIKRKELGEEQREDIAHYDNATRYNDLVVNNIFEIYKSKDAIVVYVSDHGDCVYDDKALTFGRTLDIKSSEERLKVLHEVPMIIWCSDKYKENHPDIVERIRNSVDRPFMHDDICHVLFDLAGIYTSHYNPSRSVINEKFKARQRVINDGSYNYDTNKSRLDKVRLRTEDN